MTVRSPKRKHNKKKGKARIDHQGSPRDNALSLVDCRLDSDSGPIKVASFAYQLLKSRPDIPGVYVMRANPSHYQILWSDAAGVVASQEIRWENLEPMFSYVYSLYKPPKSHILLDETITSPTRKFSPRGTLRWSIEGPDQKTYHNCVSLYKGNPWGRRTNVWSYTEKGNPDNVVVIKDAYRDVKRRYKEEGMLGEIHKNGIYPGVVRLLVPKEEMPCPDIKTAVPQTGSYVRPIVREKVRLFLGSFGQEFRYAKTVKDILLATYDILEGGCFPIVPFEMADHIERLIVHRGLVNDRKILHRDISSYNVLMYPKHNPKTSDGKTMMVPNPPIFINQVLSTEDTIPRSVIRNWC